VATKTGIIGTRAGKRTASMRLAGIVASVVALVLAGTACEPVVHAVATTVEPYGGPVELKGLSADGNFAFVRATGAGATVPGAGSWRVDRRDGTVVELPPFHPSDSTDGRWVHAWSGDGHRIQTDWYEIWDEGNVVVAPTKTWFAESLAFGLVLDPVSERFHRWDVATDSQVDVEAGFPRPDGFEPQASNLRPPGVSIDGSIVWFSMHNPSTNTCMTRFIVLNAGHVADFPFCGAMEVAANGTSFVRTMNLYTEGDPFYVLGGPTRLEFFQILGGNPPVVLEQTGERSWFDRVEISDSGWVLWAVATSASGGVPPWAIPCGTPTRPCPCGGPFGPPCPPFDFGARSIIAASPTEQRTFAVDPQLSTFDAPTETAHVSLTSDGRWLAYDTGEVGDPVHVLDRTNGQDEHLGGGSDHGPRGVTISDDASVVAYTGAGAPLTARSGWFEHEVAAGPGL
jgi:hypothetical protein